MDNIYLDYEKVKKTIDSCINSDHLLSCSKLLGNWRRKWRTKKYYYKIFNSLYSDLSDRLDKKYKKIDIWYLEDV